MWAWALFRNPVTLSFYSQIWLMLPLCASVAVVYKAVRTQDLRRLPLEILGAFLYILAGLGALGAALWLILAYWP